MSYTIYVLHAAFAVMEPRQWVSAIDYLEKRLNTKIANYLGFDINSVLITYLRKASVL